MVVSLSYWDSWSDEFQHVSTGIDSYKQPNAAPCKWHTHHVFCIELFIVGPQRNITQLVIGLYGQWIQGLLKVRAQRFSYSEAPSLNHTFRQWGCAILNIPGNSQYDHIALPACHVGIGRRTNCVSKRTAEHWATIDACLG